MNIALGLLFGFVAAFWVFFGVDYLSGNPSAALSFATATFTVVFPIGVASFCIYRTFEDKASEDKTEKIKKD